MTANSRFAVSLHVLAYLAFRRGEAVSSAEIAESVDTHAVVIRRLLSALTRAKLVKSTKGAAGGFSLAIEPTAVTLLEVYRAMNPQPDRGLKHFSPNQACPIGAEIESVLEAIFQRARAKMEAELSQISLADLHAQLAAVCDGKR